MALVNGAAGLTVLVVEDDWFVRDAIVNRLRDAGLAVLEAARGEDAVALLDAEETVHVLFTDIRLGGKLNGWDVAEAFRAARPHIGVIYASGYVIEPPRRVTGSLFFDKPYSHDAILAAMQQVSPLH